MQPSSVFLDFSLPNATTWFYFSLLLAVGLFFKFSRLLSMRNLDVLTLFVLVPGLLLVRQETQASLAESQASLSEPGPVGSDGEVVGRAPSSRVLWFAYLWLLAGSGYFFVRCLIDLALERRPALGPNLNFGGLAWLGGTLLVCLVTVALRSPAASNEEKVGKETPAVAEAEKRVAELVPPALDTGRNTRFWVGRSLAIGCHAAIVAALIFIGWRHFHHVTSGMAAATFYLLLPYTALHVGQLHHVWPTALLLWAVALYRWPTLAGVFLGIAAGSVYFPALTFPVWLSFYWRRGAGRFALAFLLSAAACLGVMGVTLWLAGTFAHSLQSAGSLADWQPWMEPTTQGFWTGITWAYRLPVFIAYVAFVTATAFWPMPKNLAHLIALSAAVLIGIQFWYADQGGVYVLWYLPLLVLLVFRPNLSDRQPPPIVEGDWLARTGRGLAALAQRLFRPPQPASVE